MINNGVHTGFKGCFFSMPDEFFYPTVTNVCVMVWEAHTPHDSSQETFFGYCKDDEFVKRKKKLEKLMQIISGIKSKKNS